VVAAPTVRLRRRPNPSYAKLAEPEPPIAVSSFRAFHVNVRPPSPVRLPLSSYVCVAPPHAVIWLAASYVAGAARPGRRRRGGTANYDI
jgi:hypothetical protein